MKVKQIESFDSSVINLIMGSDKIGEDQKAAPHKIKQSIKRTRPYTQAKTQAKTRRPKCSTNNVESGMTIVV